jgi:hypothetical protein
MEANEQKTAFDINFFGKSKIGNLSHAGEVTGTEA